MNSINKIKALLREQKRSKCTPHPHIRNVQDHQTQHRFLFARWSLPGRGLANYSNNGDRTDSDCNDCVEVGGKVR